MAGPSRLGATVAAGTPRAAVASPDGPTSEHRMRMDREVGVRGSPGGIGWVIVATAVLSAFALLVAVLITAWVP
jgi:hypothetical protein